MPGRQENNHPYLKKIIIKTQKGIQQTILNMNKLTCICTDTVNLLFSKHSVTLSLYSSLLALHHSGMVPPKSPNSRPQDNSVESWLVKRLQVLHRHSRRRSTQPKEGN